MTAYLAIALLHQNEAISDKDLTQTATPLMFAALLLVFISVLARLPGSAERIFTILPLAVGGGLAAAWLASTSWSFEPGEAAMLAIAMLGLGGVAALAARGLERLYSRSDRKTERRRFLRLSRAGYRVEERELRPGLPSARRGARGPTVSCWARKGRTYFDLFGLRQLRGLVDARWDRLAEDRGGPPLGPTVLTAVHVPNEVLWLAKRRAVRVSTLAPDADEEIRDFELEPNADGLYDVTDLGMV
jgi:hypothetical protein